MALGAAPPTAFDEQLLTQQHGLCDFPAALPEVKENDAMLAETVLPDHDEFTRRLLSVDGDPHKMERLYPALTRRAGTQVTGTGLVLALHLAAEEYTREMPPVVAFTLLLQLDSYVRALVDDKTVQRDALAALDKIRP